MDLRRLAHLVALAEFGNFARAAAQLHLSQPALTRSVQAAEAELGLRLFDRGPNGELWFRTGDVGHVDASEKVKENYYYY